MPDVGVVIPAAGRGRRMGGRIPKQFLMLDGVPILLRSVDVFARRRDIRQVVLVVPGAHRRRVERMLRGYRHRSKVSIVAGARVRQESVRAGIEALEASVAIVLVHDAVRPLVRPEVVAEVIRCARRYGASLAGSPVRDTIKKEGRREFATETVPRERLWAVQTPQGFRRELLERAHRRARRDGFVGTDEASLVERLHIPVRIVRSGPENVKITVPGDLRMAVFLLKSRKR